MTILYIRKRTRPTRFIVVVIVNIFFMVAVVIFDDVRYCGNFIKKKKTLMRDTNDDSRKTYSLFYNTNLIFQTISYEFFCFILIFFFHTQLQPNMFVVVSIPWIRRNHSGICILFDVCLWRVSVTSIKHKMLDKRGERVSQRLWF